MDKTLHRTILESKLAKCISTGSGYALDLGYGDLRYKRLIEERGYNYIGIDLFSKANMVTGDAHKLPFKKGAFQLILSIETMQFLISPIEVM